MWGFARPTINEILKIMIGFCHKNEFNLPHLLLLPAAAPESGREVTKSLATVKCKLNGQSSAWCLSCLLALS